MDNDFTNELDYDKFKSKTNILFCKNASNSSDVKRFFTHNINNCDGVAYLVQVKFPRFGDELHIDCNNSYYYEYKPNADFDVLDSVILSPSNTKAILTFNIGDVSYEQNEFTEFINLTSNTHELRFRLTFTDLSPTTTMINDVYTIYYRSYILNPKLKQKLTSKTIITKSNVYSNGTCCKLKNHPKYHNYTHASFNNL